MNLNLKSISRIFVKKHLSYKLHALRRIREYLTIEKARVHANVFIDSQFSYTTLIWVFAEKTLTNKICKIHPRILQMVYNEYIKSHKELLQLNSNVPIHQRHFSIWLWEFLNPLCIFLRNSCGLTLIRTLFRVTLEREPKYFYLQLNIFVLALILYISEEVSYGITSLY